VLAGSITGAPASWNCGDAAIGPRAIGVVGALAQAHQRPDHERAIGDAGDVLVDLGEQRRALAAIEVEQHDRRPGRERVLGRLERRQAGRRDAAREHRQHRSARREPVPPRIERRGIDRDAARVDRQRLGRQIEPVARGGRGVGRRVAQRRPRQQAALAAERVARRGDRRGRAVVTAVPSARGDQHEQGCAVGHTAVDGSIALAQEWRRVHRWL